VLDARDQAIAVQGMVVVGVAVVGLALQGAVAAAPYIASAANSVADGATSAYRYVADAVGGWF
jgi:sugar phosphate permease